MGTNKCKFFSQKTLHCNAFSFVGRVSPAYPSVRYLGDVVRAPKMKVHFWPKTGTKTKIGGHF